MPLFLIIFTSCLLFIGVNHLNVFVWTHVFGIKKSTCTAEEENNCSQINKYKATGQSAKRKQMHSPFTLAEREQMHLSQARTLRSLSLVSPSVL